MNNQKIIIKVDKILNAIPGTNITLPINLSYKNVFDEFKLSEKITGNITIENVSYSQLVAFFNLKTAVELTCARCLKKFKMPLSLSYQQDYDQKEKEDSFIISKNKTIDIYPSIRQEILLSIPIMPLCSKNCKGIKTKLEKRNL